MGEICAVRHGETEWSLSGQHTGLTDIPLTENGRRLAAELAPTLTARRFAAVFVSPLSRARETCRLAGLDGVAQIEPDLMEWNYGAYEGLTTAQIQAKQPGWMIFRDGAPGGESPKDVAARVDRLIVRIRKIAGDVAIFSHGHVLRVFAVRWIGLPPECGCHFLLDTGTVSVLGYDRNEAAIRIWNAPVVAPQS